MSSPMVPVPAALKSMPAGAYSLLLKSTSRRLVGSRSWTWCRTRQRGSVRKYCKNFAS